MVKGQSPLASSANVPPGLSKQSRQTLHTGVHLKAEPHPSGVPQCPAPAFPSALNIPATHTPKKVSGYPLFRENGTH